VTTPPSRKRRMSSDKQRAMVASSAEDALPTSQIRDRYGISESTLYRIPQRNGIRFGVEWVAQKRRFRREMG